MNEILQREIIVDQVAITTMIVMVVDRWHVRDPGRVIMMIRRLSD